MPTDSSVAFLGALSAARRVLLATHVKPDGDAIGSVAAMALALRHKQIESRVLLFHPLPQKYSFAFEENQISSFHIQSGWPGDVGIHSFDTLLVLDTGTWNQLPGLKEALQNFRGRKLVLDHHLTQEDWADLKWVETDAAAAGEIVAELLRRWNVPLDQPIATALYLAVATDTGWFQFSNTRPRTLRLAAELMEAGVDTERLYRLAYQNERPQRLALAARALQSLELLSDNRLAAMSITCGDFQQTGAAGADTENLVNLPLQVGAVQIAILVVELPEGGPVQVSFRSKGQINVAAVAQKFKGGGHTRAAGAKIPGAASEVRQKVVAALLSELAALKS